MNDETSRDDLRRMIARVDPAAALAPASADQITRLTEEAMSETPQTTLPTAPAAPRSRARVWALAAVGAVAVAGAAAIAVPLLTPAPVVTTLTLADVDPLTAICLENTPETVGQAEYAFRAEVTGIEAGTVSLRVLDDFQGDIGDIVEVEQGDGVPIDGAPIVFQDGATYLVTTDGETVGGCSPSGIESPELLELFEAAFGG